MKTITLTLIFLLANLSYITGYQGESPMGKTWVVFVENTNYHYYVDLHETERDINLMKNALSDYKIDSIIHKRNLTKNKMEEFFYTELKESVIDKRVNSLMVWYAGHGKHEDNTGYWMPVDVIVDDNSSFYNINYLREALSTYSEHLKHTLVVTDACEAGPTFYQAMRSIPQSRNCDEITVTKYSSSQTIISSGYEFLPEPSVFTRTFAALLNHNINPCLPIENVVNQLIISAARNNKPLPRFGKITGMPDEGGTFFFIKKE